MKDKIPIVIIIIIVIGYYSMSAWSDYTWEKRYLAARGSGWILYKKMENNILDPIHLYAIIKPPITSIAMIDTTITQKLSSGVYYVRMLWANKELGGGVSEDDFKYLMDCNKKREGWEKGKNGSESVEPSEIYDSSITWSSFYENEDKYPDAGASKEAECIFLENNIK